MEIIGRLTLVQNKYATSNKCINFKSKEQEDELISQFPHRNFDSNIFMQDGDTILVPLNYEECIKYNYCYFNNRINDTEKKRYFCYITGYSYVEPNVTRITIAVDTLQTFFFDIDKFRGNIQRCHSARRINLGSEELPRYIINPDLYFMEDDVNDNYVAKASKEGNNLPPYLVLTFAIPYADTDVVVQGCVNNLGKYAEAVPDTISWFGVKVVGISFPDQYGVGFNVKSIGDTQLYSIVLSARNDFVSFTGYKPTMSFTEFRNRYPVLMDKLVDAFYVDNPRGALEMENAMWGATQNIIDVVFNPDDIGNLTEFSGRLYFFTNARDTFVRKRIEIDANDDINPSKWSNRASDGINARLISQEKKLELFPYSFVKITHMNNDFIWKYQEQYKFLTSALGLENYIYSFVSWFDITSPNPTMSSSMVSDYENLVNINDTTDLLTLFGVDTQDKDLMNYYTQYNTGLPLPSISIYQEKYTQYLNYQKALVDAGNTGASVGNALNMGFDFMGSSFTTTLSTMDTRLANALTKKGKQGVRWNNEYNKVMDELEGGLGEILSSAGTNTLAIARRYTETALNERAIKMQPMSVLHSGSGNEQFFTNLYKSNGNIMEYYICKYETKDNIKSIYEQKFYNYGYHIPVDVELTRQEFIDIISNRQYFCYMEWNSLEIESDIPTIYVGNIVGRLTNGVRFENTSDDELYQSYSINSNNKEITIPNKPMFVKNY